ncbi:sodium channel protein Nach-like [Anthonomus grandis grandis]|uniref:sodium channel protein Nach-like n=1 Tax=Anthonomus grandis grandis TaxID=2921223 RepID=UPI0021658745|nr:sodium channel protein Nach-like [Anthonomus grandis grandis]
MTSRDQRSTLYRGDLYLNILENAVELLILEIIEDNPYEFELETVFQQDKAPPHFRRNVREYLTNTYPNRLIWLVVFATYCGLSIHFILVNIEHYLANPTLVTIKNDFRNWRNSFPAATACFIDKVDLKKAEIFIKKEWGVSLKDSTYSYHLDFIKIISNLTYSTLSSLERYKHDHRFHEMDWLYVLNSVHPPLNGILATSEVNVPLDWKLVITEMGLCFSLNLKFVDFISSSQSSNKGNSEIPIKDQKSFECHYLNGLCYARYDSDAQRPLQYYIHSPLEIIHASVDPPLTVKQSEEYEANFELTETFTLEDARYLSPNQRKCRYEDEPHRPNLPGYSVGICSMMCRYELALKLCGCKPFFYSFLDGQNCDLNGLLCLSKVSHLFNQSVQNLGCYCPAPCNLMIYLKESSKVTVWETGYFDQRITFRWVLIPPTTKYQRTVLFGYNELIVYCGGTLSLFLGLSFIGMVEVMYLISDRLYQFFCSKYINRVKMIAKK